MAKDDTPNELLEALNLVRNVKAPKLESLDALASRHVARVRDIFKDRNIVGIGISEKETTGWSASCRPTIRKFEAPLETPATAEPLFQFPVISVSSARLAPTLELEMRVASCWVG